MKNLLIAGACALVAMNLSGCALLNAKPSDLAPTIDAMARAGCTGDFSFSAGAGSAAGLSPGAFHAENTFKGGCDPRNVAAPPATVLTMKDIQLAIAQALAQQAAGAQTAPITSLPPPH